MLRERPDTLYKPGLKDARDLKYVRSILKELDNACFLGSKERVEYIVDAIMPLSNLPFDVVQNLMFTSIKKCYDSRDGEMAHFLINFFSDRIRPIKTDAAISPTLDFFLSPYIPDEYSSFIFTSSGETLHNIIIVWLCMTTLIDNDLIERRLSIVISELYPSTELGKTTSYNYGIVHSRLSSINDNVDGWINNKAVDFVRKGYMRNSDYSDKPSWVKPKPLF